MDIDGSTLVYSKTSPTKVSSLLRFLAYYTVIYTAVYTVVYTEAVYTEFIR